MSGYPSGVVQVWDAKTWKEIARMETPSGLRSTLHYAILTPDWATLLVPTGTRKVVREEKGGKVEERLQADGRILMYDLATGKLKGGVPMANRRPFSLSVLPSGKSAIVSAEGSFSTSARERPITLELVDLAAGTATKLDESQGYPAFTPDGKAMFMPRAVYHRDGTVTSSLVKFDLPSGKQTKAVPQPDNQTVFSGAYLSPDGKWLFGFQTKLKPRAAALVMYSAETLEEVGRLSGPKAIDNNATFEPPLFSADGKTIVTRCGGPLIVWDVEARKTVREVPVGDFLLARMALGRDGRRVAVAGLPKFDIKGIRRDPDPADLPQPRVVVVDLADPKAESRVMVLPRGAVGSVAFSPDGGTLVVGGSGGVRVLDVAR